MKAKYIKSEDGNITVVSIGDNLLIRVLEAPPPGQAFLISNPDKSPYDLHICEIDVNIEKMSPGDILEKIDKLEQSGNFFMDRIVPFRKL